MLSSKDSISYQSVIMYIKVVKHITCTLYYSYVASLCSYLASQPIAFCEFIVVELRETSYSDQAYVVPSQYKERLVLFFKIHR